MHLWEDQYLLEVVDPDTGEVLAPREEGKLVATTLGREAMPIIRYPEQGILPESLTVTRNALAAGRM